MFDIFYRFDLDSLYWTCWNCGARVGNGETHSCSRSLTPPAPTGWRCPSCKRVWGPQVKACDVCNKAVEETQV